MSGDDLLGLDRGQQYLLVAAVGLAVVVAGLAVGSNVGSNGPLLLGVGAVMTGYGVIGAGWHGVAGSLDLTERQRIAAVLGVGVVLVATNTLVSGAVGSGVGVTQFFVGLLLVIYGGGLAISAWSD